MMQLDRSIAGALDRRHFQLILLPTEKCNFRCVYCYEDFAIGRMSPAVVCGVKAFIARKAAHLHHLEISWFGGEPLLARTIVEDISGFAQEVLPSEQGVARFKGAMTTNGYQLDPAAFEALVACGITDYQISLDGDADGHDRTRVRIGGGPSFDMIWRNLIAIHASNAPVEILLRVHLTTDNLDSVERLLDRIDTEIGDDPRFRTMLKPVGRYGGPNDGDLPILNARDEAAILARLDARLRRAKPLDMAKAMSGYVCYAAKANSLIVRANGTLAKCTVALSDDRNSIGRIREDGTLALDDDRLQPWLAPLSTKNERHLACPYSAMGAH